MATVSFRKGFVLPHRKFTEKSKIEALGMPKKVVIPLQQHIGKECKPVVKVGDSVKVGQKIGESEGFGRREPAADQCILPDCMRGNRKWDVLEKGHKVYSGKRYIPLPDQCLFRRHQTQCKN